MAQLQTVSVNGMVITMLTILNVVLIRAWYVMDSSVKWALLVTVPMLVMTCVARSLKRKSIVKKVPRILANEPGIA